MLDFPEELRRIRGASRWQVVRMALELWAMTCAEEREEQARKDRGRVVEVTPVKTREESEAAKYTDDALTQIKSQGLVHSSLRVEAPWGGDPQSPGSPGLLAPISPNARAPGDGGGGGGVDPALLDQLADLEAVLTQGRRTWQKQ